MVRYKDQDTRLVYSTQNGRICPRCKKQITHCVCGKRQPKPTTDGVVRIGRATKGRKGKGVTTITGITLDGEGLKSLAKELKQKCGSGGTIKNGTIEIQGDHRDLLVAEMTTMGYHVRRSGG